MENRGYRTFKALAWVGMFLPLALSFSCRLDLTGPHAEIYPKDGSRDVPVNTVIEVQFPPELGITDDQMNEGLFSIDECDVNPFGYLNPEQPSPAQTTAPATNTKTKKTTSKKAEATPEETPGDDTMTDSGTKYGANVKFYYAHHADSTKTVFNYLVINPESHVTPLKAGTTYCVRVKKLKNAAGEKIAEKEISFTTEDSASFNFDPKIDVDFFGNRLAPTVLDQKDHNRDFILVSIRNQSIRPNQIKSKIKLCQATTDNVSTTEACKDYGKSVPSYVYLIEGLKTDEEKRVLGSYSLFAIAPRVTLEPGQKFKVVINLDIDKSEDSYMDKAESEFEVDSDTTLSWPELYKNEIRTGDGKSVFSPIQQFLYVGSTS